MDDYIGFLARFHEGGEWKSQQKDVHSSELSYHISRESHGPASAYLSSLLLFVATTSRWQTEEDLACVVNHPLETSESTNHDLDTKSVLA